MAIGQFPQREVVEPDHAISIEVAVRKTTVFLPEIVLPDFIIGVIGDVIQIRIAGKQRDEKTERPARVTVAGREGARPGRVDLPGIDPLAIEPEALP
jgi:hypothetical protein